MINLLNRFSYIVKQYLKTGLSIYQLCLYNHNIYCIIALVFYEVGNKKTTIPAWTCFGPEEIDGCLKAEEVAAL